MKSRIKVVVHAGITTSGDEERTWLLLDTELQTTAADCLEFFAKQLNLGSATSLELCVDGFRLVDSLPADTLDPAKDLIEIRRRKRSTSDQPTQHKAKRVKRSHQTSHAEHSHDAHSADHAVPIERPPSPQAIANGPSRSQSLNTRTVPTKTTEPAILQQSGLQSSLKATVPDAKALKAATASALPATAAEASTSTSSSASSSSSSSSDEDESDSSSESSSSSSSTSSSSSSSSTSSSSDSDGKPEQQGVRQNISQGAATEVPPGRGKTSTKARNARKRQRQRLLKQAAAAIAGPQGLGKERPAPSFSEKANVPNLCPQKAAPAADELHIPPGEGPSYMLAPGPLQSHASIGSEGECVGVSSVLSLETSKGRTHPNASKEDMRMLSLSAGNSKKAKSIRRDLLSGRRQTNKKTTFDEDIDMSPILHSSSVSVPASDLSGVTSGPSAQNAHRAVHTQANGVRRPPPPPPSTRSDLPSNVFVTSVDVEAADFVPGAPTANFIAPPQVPYTNASKPNTSANAYFNAYSGYYGEPESNASTAVARNSPSLAAPTAAGSRQNLPNGSRTFKTSNPYNCEGADWLGWPGLQELEEGMFERSKPIAAPGDGENVAVKVLELSPSSYMPSVSLYYGKVVNLESSPHSSMIRLKLHPSCKVMFKEAQEEADLEGDDGPRLPRYFGEDLELADDGAVAGVKVIKLDDIVDCRRLTIR